jgi:hypothetical protein
MKNTTLELVQRTRGRDTLNAAGGNNYLDGDNTLLGGAGVDVMNVLFGRSKFDAANDTEERMAA